MAVQCRPVPANVVDAVVAGVSSKKHLATSFVMKCACSRLLSSQAVIAVCIRPIIINNTTDGCIHPWMYR